jgi:hypothetical protein
MNIRAHFTGIVTALLAIAGASHAARAEPLRIFYFNWAGFGPFFPDQPGQIYHTAQYAIDVWSSLGELDFELTPADVIRHDLWTE